jgi:hypothetical protein
MKNNKKCNISIQEKHERKVDYSKELRDLEDEGDLPMDELYKKYAAAYDSDFEVPEEESDFDEDETEEEETDKINRVANKTYGRIIADKGRRLKNRVGQVTVNTHILFAWP